MGRGGRYGLGRERALMEEDERLCAKGMQVRGGGGERVREKIERKRTSIETDNRGEARNTSDQFRDPVSSVSPHDCFRFSQSFDGLRHEQMTCLRRPAILPRRMRSPIPERQCLSKRSRRKGRAGREVLQRDRGL